MVALLWLAAGLDQLDRTARVVDDLGAASTARVGPEPQGGVHVHVVVHVGGDGGVGTSDTSGTSGTSGANSTAGAASGAYQQPAASVQPEAPTGATAQSNKPSDQAAPEPSARKPVPGKVYSATQWLSEFEGTEWAGLEKWKVHEAASRPSDAQVEVHRSMAELARFLIVLQDWLYGPKELAEFAPDAPEFAPCGASAECSALDALRAGARQQWLAIQQGGQLTGDELPALLSTAARALGADAAGPPEAAVATVLTQLAAAPGLAPRREALLDVAKAFGADSTFPQACVRASDLVRAEYALSGFLALLQQLTELLKVTDPETAEVVAGAAALAGERGAVRDLKATIDGATARLGGGGAAPVVGPMKPGAGVHGPMAQFLEQVQASVQQHPCAEAAPSCPLLRDRLAAILARLDREFRTGDGGLNAEGRLFALAEALVRDECACQWHKAGVTLEAALELHAEDALTGIDNLPGAGLLTKAKKTGEEACATVSKYLKGDLFDLAHKAKTTVQGLNLAGAIANAGSDLANAGSGLLGGIGDGIKGVVGGIGDGIKGVLE